MPQKEYSLVGIGGTFDHIHKGHEALLQKAFKIGEHVLIGITSEEMLFEKDYAKKIKPYTQRVKNMESYLQNNRLLQQAKIVKLNDRYGPAITIPEMDAIIVTEETRPTAEEINDIRKANRLMPLTIISVPRVLAEDGVPISSSRIRAGTINKNGKLLEEEKK